MNAAQVAIQDLNYAYDSVGNILSIIDNVNTADQTFEYDELNRLTAATGEAYGAKTFQYDEIGNILQKGGMTYTYGAGNAGPHAVTSLSDGTTMTYDANGNMATMTENGVVTAYTYDVENRLTAVTRDGQPVADFEYDGDGGRTKKTSYGPATTITRFVGSLYEENASRETRYVFLGDMRVASVTGDKVLYYHADHLAGRIFWPTTPEPSKSSRNTSRLGSTPGMRSTGRQRKSRGSILPASGWMTRRGCFITGRVTTIPSWAASSLPTPSFSLRIIRRRSTGIVMRETILFLILILAEIFSLPPLQQYLMPLPVQLVPLRLPLLSRGPSLDL